MNKPSEKINKPNLTFTGNARVRGTISERKIFSSKGKVNDFVSIASSWLSQAGVDSDVASLALMNEGPQRSGPSVQLNG